MKHKEAKPFFFLLFLTFNSILFALKTKLVFVVFNMHWNAEKGWEQGYKVEDRIFTDSNFF